MKKNICLIILLSILFIFSYFSFVYAYDLKDAVDSVLRNNKQLQISQKKLESVILEKKQVITEFLPNINLEWAKIFENPSDKMSYYGASSFNTEFFTLSIKQDIYTGGSTIAKLSVYDAKIESAYQEYNKFRNEIILRTVQSYQNVLTYREITKVHQINVRMAKKSVEKAKINIKSGSETKSVIFLARAHLSSLQSDLADCVLRKNQAYSSFKYFVGEEPPITMKAIEVKKYAKIQNINEFEALVYNQNPSLIKVRSDSKLLKKEINVLSSALLPRVHLFTNIIKPKISENNYSTRPFKGNQYGVSIIVPLLYKGGIQYLNISDMKKKSQSHELNVRDMTDKILSQTINVWDQYISSQKIYKLSQIAEDNYYQVYLSAKSEFNIGAKTLIELISKQRNYNDYRIKRIFKERDYTLSLFEIYNLTGNLLQVINMIHTP